MEETQLHECSVRESDPMTSQYRCGGNIRIYPWYLILDTHSPYIYIHTYFYILYFHIYIYIYYSNIHTVLYTYSITVWTHTHTFESTDVGSMYFVANPRKWWSIESSLLLRLSNPVEIAVVTLQQAGEVVGTGCVVNCCVLPKDPLNPRLTKKHIVSYTPVNEHSNGKWTIWRCISYWNWGCSIAMLVYQRVVILAVHLFTNSFLVGRVFCMVSPAS